MYWKKRHEKRARNEKEDKQFIQQEKLSRLKMLKKKIKNKSRKTMKKKSIKVKEKNEENKGEKKILCFVMISSYYFYY